MTNKDNSRVFGLSSWVNSGAIAEMYNTREKQAGDRNGNQELRFLYVRFEMPIKFQVSNWL